MTLDEALGEIEGIIRKLDPIMLYQSHLVRELQNIVRRVQEETHDQTIQEVSRT